MPGLHRIAQGTLRPFGVEQAQELSEPIEERLNDTSIICCVKRTLTRRLLGCFFSNLLQANTADLFELVSSASE